MDVEDSREHHDDDSDDVGHLFHLPFISYHASIAVTLTDITSTHSVSHNHH